MACSVQLKDVEKPDHVECHAAKVRSVEHDRGVTAAEDPAQSIHMTGQQWTGAREVGDLCGQLA